jgi:hypothetical protein
MKGKKEPLFSAACYAIAEELRYPVKETNRKWEEVDDISVLSSRLPSIGEPLEWSRAKIENEP